MSLKKKKLPNQESWIVYNYLLRFPGLFFIISCLGIFSLQTFQTLFFFFEKKIFKEPLTNNLFKELLTDNHTLLIKFFGSPKIILKDLLTDNPYFILRKSFNKLQTNYRAYLGIFSRPSWNFFVSRNPLQIIVNF